jgi:hypothetical protein
MRYASVWLWTWTFVAAGGVGLAMLEWSTVAVIIVVLGITTVMAALLSMLSSEPAVRRRANGSVGHMFTWSVTVAFAGTGLLALLTVSPPLALLVVLLIAVTSPRLVSLVLRRSTQRPPRHPDRTARGLGPATEPDDPPVAPVPPSQEQVDVTTLSDKELFYLWRRTFWELRGSAAVDDRLTVISLRQACLEELERRDPDGLSAWLDSGGRASGGPERYWRTPPRPKEDHDD